MPTLFPEARLRTTRSIHGYLEREKDTLRGAIVQAVTQARHEDYGAEVERLEELVNERQERRARRRRRRQGEVLPLEADGSYQYVYSGHPPSRDPVVDQMQQLHVDDTGEVSQPDAQQLEAPEGYMHEKERNVQAASRRSPQPKVQAGSAQPRRRGFRARIAENALRAVRELDLILRGPDARPARAARQAPLERTRSERPHRPWHDGRAKGSPHRHRHRRGRRRHSGSDASDDRRPRRRTHHRHHDDDYHRSRQRRHYTENSINASVDSLKTHAGDVDDDSESLMMSGALPPQPTMQQFPDQQQSTEQQQFAERRQFVDQQPVQQRAPITSLREIPEDAQAYLNTPSGEVYPTDSPSRAHSSLPAESTSAARFDSTRHHRTAGVVEDHWTLNDARLEDVD